MASAKVAALALLVTLFISVSAEDFVCPLSEGIFAHPKDCTSFYQCRAGQATLRVCSAPLHFNPKAKECDWPLSDTCQPDEYDNSMDPYQPGPEGPPAPAPPGVVCPDNVCVCHLKDPYSCNYYYRCHNGTPIKRKCPDGLYYNPDTQVCDLKENVDCGRTTTPKRPPITTTTPKRPPVTTTSKPLPPGECLNKCPQIFGLFPCPGNCRKFVHCSHDIPYTKDCPAELHFNPRLRVCDWPDRAGCCNTTNCPPPVTPPPVGECDCDCCLMTDWNDCSKYYLCLGKKKHHMSCAEGLFFNHKTENCDKRENLDRWCPEPPQSTKPPTRPPTQPPTKPPTPRPTRPPVTTTTPKRPPVTTTSKPLPPGECLDKCPQIFGLFPCPGNCKKFVHCSHDIPYTKDCPAELHFNPRLRVCDWPDRAGCCNTTNCPPPVTPPPVGECDCDCCLMTDWNDCSKYYLCLGKKKHHMSCAEGLFFNHKTENCDKRENLDRWCPEPPQSTKPPTRPPSQPPTRPIIPRPTRPPTQRPTRPPTQPPTKPPTTPATIPPTDGPCSLRCPEIFGLFPYKCDCEKFIHCSHGIPYLKTCPAKLHFNRVLQVCDYPYRAGCNGTSPTGAPVTDGPPVGPCDCDCCLRPDPDDCSKFFICLGGQSYHHKCGEGLLFNKITETCDLAENVDCGGKTECPDCPECPTPTPEIPKQCPNGDGVFPHPDVPEKCNSYIVCKNGKETVRRCPGGLHFNPSKKSCDLPENAKCDPKPIGNCSCNCCFVQDDCSCEHYYMCEHGHLTRRECGKGLVFDPAEETCNFPENVDRKCPPNKIPTFPPDPTTPGHGGGTTPSPGCPAREGLFPHPDCTKFIHCAHWIPYVKDCPKPLHFSVARQRCEWPCIAKCDPSVKPCDDTTSGTTPKTPTPTPTPRPGYKCPSREGHFPHKDCSKFYHCANWIPYVKDCPPPLHFSVARDRCEWPCIAKCDPKVKPCDDDTTSGTTPKTPTPTPTPGPGYKCPSREGHFPHKDCTKFYHCANWIPYVKDCPSPLHFSVARDRCEWPCIAKCDPKVKPCDDDTYTTSGLPVSKTTPGGPVYKCPDREGHFPHPDCTKFYHCANWLPYVKDCPSPLHFSVARDRCEWPCIAKCDPKVKPCDDDTYTTSGLPVTKTTPEGPVYKCPDREGHFPHPDCTKFYHCANWLPYIKDCPKPLHFSVERDRCEWPCIAKCDPKVKPCPTIPDVTPPTATTPGSGGDCPCLDCVLHDPSDCSAYFQCRNGKPHRQKCRTGQLFDRIKKRCAPAGSVDCPSVGDPEYCKDPFGIYPLPGRCSHWIQCDHGVAVIQQCPMGTEFNPDLMVCDWPGKTCGSNSTVDKRCPKPAGLFPHEDCTKFIHCDHGIPYIKDCPEPLHFNPKLKVCDWPRDAGCGTDHGDDGSTGEDDFVWGCNETPGIACPPCSCRVPNYDSCTSFYQCTSSGKACAKNCPMGLHFNKKTHVCDFPPNAGCALPAETNP